MIILFYDSEILSEELMLQLKIDNYTVKIHRSNTSSEKERAERLTLYIDKICELGKKYMPEIMTSEQ